MRTQIKLALAAMVVVAVSAMGYAQAAPTTWTGKISDAMCGASHGANGGTDVKDHDCAVKCVKGGSTYVFVNKADSKIFKIANQKFAGLDTHAGHTDVTITGTLKDDAITVTKIAMPKAKAK